MSRAALLLAALCAALLLAAPAQAAREVPRGWLGVHVDGPLVQPGNPYRAEWRLMRETGVETVRTAFDWRVAQPTADGPIDFSVTDAVVLAAAGRRLPVLPVVHRTPAWAAARPSDGASSPPVGTAAYTRYLTALVRRYGPRGSLWREHPRVPRVPIRAWQVWNEPNIPYYWSAQPFARSYVKLLRASRRALHAADPRARVIVAGLTNKSWSALRAIYRAGGRGAFDAVALHPFTRRPRDVVRIIRLARAVTRRFHDRRTPIWITELSWPASRGRALDEPGFATDERGQAARLTAAVALLARERRRLGIGKVIWYTWVSPVPSSFVFDWSGLRRERRGIITEARSLAAFRHAAQRIQH